MRELYLKIRLCCLRILEVSTCTALLGLLVILLLQIASRMLKMPISGTMTWSTLLLMWVAFPAACLGLEKKMQLGVDLLYNALPGGIKRWLDVIAGVSIMLFAILAMCYGGGVISFFLLKNHEVTRFMFYLPLILSGVFMSIQGLERVVTGIYGITLVKSGEEK